MSALAMTPELLLPWESSLEEDARYRRILRGAMLAFLVMALVLPLLPVRELTREQQSVLPEHLARVVLEKKELPPPVQPAPPPKPKPELAPQPEPKPLEKVPPKPPQQVNRLEQARKSASVAGVLAFEDALAELRDSVDVDALSRTGTSKGQATAAKLERAVISSASEGSGGIQTAAVSQDTGGAALSGRETTRVESPQGSARAAGAGQRSVELGGRSDESIRRVMDSKKGSIFAIYNRALRQDPMLQGKLVFEMVIDATGAVAELTLLSSELSDDALTRKILARIRMIGFGPEDVETTRVNYSFDFLPY